MKSSTRILSVVLAVLMLVTAVPIAVFTTDSDASSDASLPSSYKIDSKYITPIRNQGSEGVCWSFGMTAALETELIQMGYDNADTILSPLYESYSIYDTDTYSGSGDAVVLLTGTLGTVGTYSFESSMVILNGRGPLYEYVAPYSQIGSYNLSSDIAYSNILTVRGLETYDPYNDADIIKQKLIEGHAGLFSFYATGDKVNCYAPRLESIWSNHAVCLVGYDDNYSKDNFKVTVPEGDGAWIVKNSWGTDTSQGFNGYTYVSYYSSIENVTFYTDVTVNNGTLDTYSYDNGYSVMSDKEYRGSVTMSNVFTCERDGYIDSALFPLFDKQSIDQEYTVYVYKLNKNYNNPTDGKLIAVSETSNTDYRNGSFNSYLSSSEQLKKGDKFSVCIELKGETCCVPIDTYECYENNHVSYTVAEKGQSYVCYNGKWTDISADGISNIRIKAFIKTDNEYEATLNGTYYGSFSDAVKDAKSGDVISLLKDVTCDPVTINKDIKIRFRGYDMHVSGKGASAITIDNANVIMDYGRIFYSGDSIININKGSLTANYMSFRTDEYAVTSNDAALSFNSILYDGYNPLMLTGGTASLVNCYITAIDEIVESHGCKVTINGGDYVGNTLYQDDVGDIIVKAGTYDFKIGDELLDSDSFQETASAKRYRVQTREVTVDGHPEIKSFRDAVFDKAQNGFVVTLLKDIYPDYAYVGSLLETYTSMTIDLNGHSITKTDVGTCFISDYEGTVTLKNSSDKRSAINVLDFCDNRNTNGVTVVEDNIDIIAMKSIYMDGKNWKMTISDKSTACIVSETAGGKTTAYPYINDKGKYCEDIEVKIYGELKEVKYICYGKAEDVFRENPSYRYQATGIYTDGQGNELGKWDRTYVVGSRQVMSDNVAFTMTLDVFTDKNGNRDIQYSDVIGAYLKTASAIDNNGVCRITTESVGKVSDSVTKPQIDAAVEVNNTAVDSIKVLTENYQRSIVFVSNHDVDKILKADDVNGLFDKGYDVGIKTATYSFVMKCGTGKLTGDTVLKVDKVGRSELTNKADEAIGTGIAYSVYATVNGEKVKELPCLSEITLYRYHCSGDRISVLNSDGSLSSIDVKNTDSSDTFTLTSSSIIAVNPASTSGTASNTIMIVAIAAIAAVSVIGIGVFLWRKP